MIKQEGKRQKHPVWTYLFWYTLLFAATAFGVYIWFVLSGRSMCWETDTSSQYIPKAVYFIRETREFVKGLLRGEFNFKMYDFNVGFGDAVPLHLEPVYWLYLLFPASRVEFAYQVLLLLRFYLAGLSFSVFLAYFCCPRWNCLIGSMVYVFSGFGLFAGMRHSHFIVPMIMLPLLLLSMEEIYRKKRWYLCTVFVAVSFWCGYYFTYMNTILMGVYFLIRFFGGNEKRSLKEFLLRMRTIIASYLLGIGIANLTFFNTFANYLGSARSGLETENLLSLWEYGEDWIRDFYACFLTTAKTPGSWLWLGFIPLSYLCIVLLFLRKGNRQLKASFLIGTLFCMVPVFAWIFSGFGGINNRWCYGYAFVVAVITANMVGELKNIGKKEWFFLFLSSVPYISLELGNYFGGGNYSKSVLLSGGMLLLSLLAVALLRLFRRISDRVKYAVLTAGTIGMIWLSGMYRFSPDYADMLGDFTKQEQVWSTAAGTALQVMDEVEDDSFYRSYTKNSSSDVQGASMMLGYNGVVYYSSTLNGVLVDFYRELGLTSWSLVRLRGFDGRGFLNALACVKYQAMSDEEPYDLPYGYEEVKKVLRNEVYYTIYENENVLPAGYTYDKVISLEEFEKLDTAERQEVMLQAAVVDDPEQVSGCEVITADMVRRKTQDNSTEEGATLDGTLQETGDTAAGNEEDAEDAEADDIAAGKAEDISNGSKDGNTTQDADITVTGQKVSITEIACSEGAEFDGTTVRITKKNAEITVYFDGLENCETYLNLEGLRMPNADNVWMYLSSDSEQYDVSYYYHGDYDTYSTGQEDYLFHLGYTEEAKSYCTIRFSNKCKFTVDEISVYCQPMEALDGYVADRNDEAMEQVEVGINQVTGTIETSEEKLLVFSIPYQNGWTVRIDGEETTIQKVNIMYMGVTVPKGSHTIELTYEMPGLRISLVISAVSLVIFAGALWIRRKRKKSCVTAS